MRTLTLPGLLLLLPLALAAGPLTITYSGSDSGSLNGTSFTTAAFTITEVLDTANRQSFGGGFFINDSSASIAIAGLGTYSFTTATRSFVNNGASAAGFSRAGTGGLDLIEAPGSAFSTWDMTTSLGPLTVAGQIIQWTTSAVQTTGGTLVLNNASTPITFQAVAGAAAAPEPSTYGLFTAGLAALAWRMRRKIS